MDWSVLAELGKYAPFLFSEMAKRPTVSSWIQAAMKAAPNEEFAKIQADLRTNIASGAIKVPPGASTMATIVAYLPFIFTEMAKRPSVSAWVEGVLNAMPTKDVIAAIADAQAASAGLAS